MSYCPMCSTQMDFHMKASCENHPLWIPGLPSDLEWEKCPACGHLYNGGEYDRTSYLGSVTEVALPTPNSLNGQMAVWAVQLETIPVEPRGNVLDFGCGSGAAGFTAQIMGFEPYFVEIRDNVREALQMVGAKHVHKTLDEIPDVRFSMVIASDVIEHIQDPRPVLRRFREISPTLYVSTPIAEGPLWGQLGRYNPYWMEIDHYHTFSTKSLTGLLEECGWKVKKRFFGARYLCGQEWFAERTE